jgi:hypothetical protein
LPGQILVAAHVAVLSREVPEPTIEELGSSSMPRVCWAAWCRAARRWPSPIIEFMRTASRAF